MKVVMTREEKIRSAFFGTICLLLLILLYIVASHNQAADDPVAHPAYESNVKYSTRWRE